MHSTGAVHAHIFLYRARRGNMSFGPESSFQGASAFSTHDLPPCPGPPPPIFRPAHPAVVTVSSPASMAIRSAASRRRVRRTLAHSIVTGGAATRMGHGRWHGRNTVQFIVATAGPTRPTVAIVLDGARSSASPPSIRTSNSREHLPARPGRHGLFRVVRGDVSLLTRTRRRRRSGVRTRPQRRTGRDLRHQRHAAGAAGHRRQRRCRGP